MEIYSLYKTLRPWIFNLAAYSCVSHMGDESVDKVLLRS